MNAQEIKNILIAYLKATSHEIRIYQEKSIGEAVCDLMAVTDCLTGYEIKSDLDNYQRLGRQIKAYDLFFEQNYIVIGGRHLNTAARRLPDHWGIITIQSDQVIVNRPARAGNPSCASQLGVLWKLELTNLLTKTGLPLYTYKSKQYIINQIVDHLDKAEIKRHVTYELMHRDYAQFDAEDYSLHFGGAQETGSRAVSGLPAAEIVDALSEQDFGEMTLDQWIALYAQAKELQKNKEDLHRVRTAPRTLHDIPYTDIEVSLGVPWVSKTIISDFIYFLRTGNEAFAATGKMLKTYVSYEPMTGYWYVEDKNLWGRDGVDRKQLEHTYGLPSYNALYILEAALNLREIRRETEEETLAALEKQEVIEKLFKEWVWQDEDRRWEIEEAYNRIFQGCRAKEYSGRELKFPEMSPDVTLFDYQKDAVMRVISEKNTLLAFDVGAGKTYIMIAAAMKMRQEGRSRKNLFVVPNHIVGQWELIFKQMYPAAKVLSVDPAAFRPQLRKKVLGQIQRGDYDGIIMAYSCFEMIPLSKEYLMEQMERKLRELDASLPGSWKERYFPGTGAAVEREKAYLKKQIFGLIGKQKNDTEAITFDQLEINTLFVDEAHNFKNIPLRSNLKGISGVNITGSKKCLEMLYKVRCVQEQNQGRGVVFATGTPLCNSISDAYAMQMYLQYDKMKETHLDRFDNWVKSFAKPERICEIDVDTSKYRFVLRFARFFNLPELSRMFSQIAAFHAVDNKEGVPRLERYSDVILPRNAALQSYMDQLCRRSEEIRASLTGITIPKGVAVIEMRAFQGCTGLKTVTVPRDTDIGLLAFVGCEGLADEQGMVIVNGTLVQYFGPGGNVIIPENVIRIGSCAFAMRDSLTNVTIPEGVTEIGGNAFDGCTNLTNVTIPESVTIIGPVAFADCASLTSLSIPKRMTDIGAGAFTGCAGLADERGMVIVNDILFDYSGPDLDVTVPEGITAISGWDFRRNASVTIPESVNEIEEINPFDDDMEYSENLLIRAPAGSYAEQYAAEHGIPLEPVPDQLRNGALKQFLPVRFAGEGTMEGGYGKHAKS